jgi:hypothetical protein
MKREGKPYHVALDIRRGRHQRMRVLRPRYSYSYGTVSGSMSGCGSDAALVLRRRSRIVERHEVEVHFRGRRGGRGLLRLAHHDDDVLPAAVDLQLRNGRAGDLTRCQFRRLKIESRQSE